MLNNLQRCQRCAHLVQAPQEDVIPQAFCQECSQGLLTLQGQALEWLAPAFVTLSGLLAAPRLHIPPQQLLWAPMYTLASEYRKVTPQCLSGLRHMR